MWFCLLVFSFFTSAQTNNFLRGKVVDAASQSSIANCSVFINSTSRGTVTNQKGEFILQNLPEGKHQLIISSIGYQTFVFEYSSAQLPLELNVSLKEKTTDLSEITIEPDVKNGWRIWGKTFLINFIGSTENANECSIKNISVLHFRFSKKANRLTVVADEPLIIENKALGYSIKYQLEQFYCDFHSQVSLYLGFPLFTEMSTSRKKKERQWEEKRKEAYLGSVMHFMKSIYANKVQQQGFNLVRKLKILNIEKQRVKNIYTIATQTTDTFQVQKDGSMKKMDRNDLISKDSIPYYESVLSKPDFFERYIPVSPDSIITVNNDGTKSIFFTDSIYVLYTTPKDLILRQSMIFLSTPQPVIIYSNGIYSPPQELFTNGYWGRFEKMANDLPIDYEEK